MILRLVLITVLSIRENPKHLTVKNQEVDFGKMTLVKRKIILNMQNKRFLIR